VTLRELIYGSTGFTLTRYVLVVFLLSLIHIIPSCVQY